MARKSVSIFSAAKPSYSSYLHVCVSLSLAFSLSFYVAFSSYLRPSMCIVLLLPHCLFLSLSPLTFAPLCISLSHCIFSFVSLVSVPLFRTHSSSTFCSFIFCVLPLPPSVNPLHFLILFLLMPSHLLFLSLFLLHVIPLLASSFTASFFSSSFSAYCPSSFCTEDHRITTTASDGA